MWRMRSGRRRRASVTAPDPTSTRSVARFLGRFVRPERTRFGLGLIVLAVEAATGVLLVWPLAYLIDYLNGQAQDLFPTAEVFGWSSRTVTIAVLTSAMVLMAATSSATDSWAEILLAKSGRNLGFAVRTELYDHLQGMSLAFHDQLRTGDTITRVTGDVEEVEDFVIDSLSDVFGSVFTLLGAIAFLFYLSWRVAIVAIVVVPILALVSHQFSSRIKVAAKKEKKSQGELASVAQEVLTSMRVIQTYGRPDYEVSRFGVASYHAVDAALRAAKLQAWFSLVVKVMEALTIAFVVWLGVWLVDRRIITLGLIVLFVLQIEKMFRPTRKIIKEWNKIGRLLASAGRINELFLREQTIVNRRDAVEVGRLAGRVQFDHVDFAYRLEDEDAARLPGGWSSSRQALSDVDFTIEPGEVVALVGHTGAGKSTVAQLLPRLYDPTAGAVRIDGIDLRNITIKSLRNNISMVHQDTMLFSGSVFDNIAYGRARASRQAVERAARQAFAHEFITDLPEGYDTLLGERGIGLSGGQRQRIAIARCLMRDTPMLILDEPTTGLDAKATEVVLNALERLIEGRTTIIISHDLQLVARTDRVLVMSHGEIVETGTHEELLALGGLYAELRAAQLGARDDSAPDRAVSARNALLDRNPDLGDAFDGTRMRPVIAEALVDEDRFALQSVSVEKDRYDVDRDAYRFRYRCRLLDRRDGTAHDGLLLARVFADAEQMARFRRDIVDEQLARPSLPPPSTPFTAAVAEFDHCNVLVTAFPVDADLPGLRTALDPTYVATLLSDALGRDVPSHELKIDVAHYGRGERCAVRYGVDGAVFYGKLRGDGMTLAGRAALRALNRQLDDLEWGGLRLPQVVAADDDRGLIVLSEVPGRPMLKDHIVAGHPDAGESAAHLVRDVGRVAAFLHSCDLGPLTVRTMDDDLALLSKGIRGVRRGSPSLGRRLEQQLDVVAAVAGDAGFPQLVPTHGDFTPSQFVVGVDALGLVDFDTLCHAEAARDLGTFMAYSHVALARSTTDRQQRLDRFGRVLERLLTGYVEGGGVDDDVAELIDRVRVHEAVNLLRMAIHSWMKHKYERLDVALSLLDEVVDTVADGHRPPALLAAASNRV